MCKTHTCWLIHLRICACDWIVLYFSRIFFLIFHFHKCSYLWFTLTLIFICLILFLSGWLTLIKAGIFGWVLFLCLVIYIKIYKYKNKKNIWLTRKFMVDRIFVVIMWNYAFILCDLIYSLFLRILFCPLSQFGIPWFVSLLSCTLFRIFFLKKKGEKSIRRSCGVFVSGYLFWIGIL